MRRTLILMSLLLALSPTAAFTQEAPVFGEVIGGVTGGELRRIGGVGRDCLALAEKGGVAAVLRIPQPEGALSILELVDTDTGAVLASRKMAADASPYAARATFLTGGGIALTDADMLTVRVLNEELAQVHSFTAPLDGGYYAVAADASGEYAYFGGTRGVDRYRLSDGKREPADDLVPPGWSFSNFAGGAEGGVLCAFSGEDGLGLLAHMTTESGARLFPLPAGFIPATDGLLSADAPDETFFLLPPDTATLYRRKAPPGGEYPAHAIGSLILMGSYVNGTAYRVLDVKTSRVLGELSVPGMGEAFFTGSALLTGGGYALFALSDYETGQGALYRWDYAAGYTPIDAGVTSTTLSALRAEHDAQAAAIHSRHGVRVYLREAGAAFRDEAYQGSPMRDEVRLGGALSQVAAFLDALPEGMIRRAAVPPLEHVDVYLCGAITPRGAGSISSAAGFVLTTQTAKGIVLSGTSFSLTALLAHEFMHVLEDGLWQDNAGTAIPVLLWENLGPQDAVGRGYAFSYHNPDGTEFADGAFTAWNESDAADVYFLDAYSRTYPLEDRARIFESLYAAADGTETVFWFPNLTVKARALCAMLRRAYPEIEAAGGAPWERFVTPMGKDELFELLHMPAEDAPAAGMRHGLLPS